MNGERVFQVNSNNQQQSQQFGKRDGKPDTFYPQYRRQEQEACQHKQCSPEKGDDSGSAGTFDTLIITDTNYVECKEQITDCKIRNSIYCNVIRFVTFVDE